MIPVKGLMRDNDMLVAQTKQTCALMIAEGIYVTEPSTLEVAFPKFEITKQNFIPVVEIEDEPILIGALYQIDALTAYTDALAETAREEHS